jgi:hypothetical protein
LPTIAPDRFEPNNNIAQAKSFGALGAPLLINNLTLNTSADVDFFSIRSSARGQYWFSAPGTEVTVLNSSGKVLAAGAGAAVYTVRPGPAMTLYVKTSSLNGAPDGNYALTMTPPTRPAPVVRAPAPRRMHPAIRPRALARLH